MATDENIRKLFRPSVCGKTPKSISLIAVYSLVFGAAYLMSTDVYPLFIDGSLAVTVNDAFAGDLITFTPIPILNATVVVTSWPSGTSFALSHVGDGIYVAPALAPQEYTVEVSAPGYVTSTSTSSAAIEGEWILLGFQLQPILAQNTARIAVVIAGTNNKAIVDHVDIKKEGSVVAVSISAVGDYNSTGLSSGEYEIEVVSSFYAVSSVTATLTGNDSHLVELHGSCIGPGFEGQIVGSVIDASGNPVEGAIIIATDSTTDHRVMEAESVDGGNYLFANICVGKYRFHAEWGSLRSATSVSFEVTDGDIIAGPTLSVEPNVVVGDQARVYLDFDLGGDLAFGTVKDPVNSLALALALVESEGVILASPGSSPETRTIEQSVILQRNEESEGTGSVIIGSPAARSSELNSASDGFVSRSLIRVQEK